MGYYYCNSVQDFTSSSFLCRIQKLKYTVKYCCFFTILKLVSHIDPLTPNDL
jgi:hypothetical protein